jgi:hypothetical protein
MSEYKNRHDGSDATENRRQPSAAAALIGSEGSKQLRQASD